MEEIRLETCSLEQKGVEEVAFIGNTKKGSKKGTRKKIRKIQVQ